jgi:hypothetical protein
VNADTKVREPEDWRRRGQESYLAGVVLVRRAYRPPPSNPDWEHDHCEFCWAKFMPGGVHDSLRVGFATVDDYHWICEPCFADFREEFGWRVEQGTDTTDA